jgi:hypothetical protein
MHHSNKKRDEGEVSVSDMVLTVARVWLYMALGALVLYFIVAAIEHHRVTLNVEFTHAYRVPIELPESEETTNG